MGITLCAKNANKGILGEWTGGPAFQGCALFKKMEGSSPVRVIGIPKRNQHINIQKLDHALPVKLEMILPSSSSYW